MEEKASIYYRDILSDFTSIDLKSPLPKKLVEKIDFVINHGNAREKLWAVKLFVCCVLDDRIPSCHKEQALDLLEKTFTLYRSRILEPLYNRILIIANRATQEQAAKYIRLAFKLGWYDSLFDLSYVLLSDEKYSCNVVQYTQQMYQLLNSSLKETSPNPFIAVVITLLRNIETYPVLESTIRLIENAKLSEYWSPRHTELLKESVRKYALKNPGNNINELNKRLNLVEEGEQSNQLHSSQSASRS